MVLIISLRRGDTTETAMVRHGFWKALPWGPRSKRGLPVPVWVNDAVQRPVFALSSSSPAAPAARHDVATAGQTTPGRRRGDRRASRVPELPLTFVSAMAQQRLCQPPRLPIARTTTARPPMQSARRSRDRTPPQPSNHQSASNAIRPPANHSENGPATALARWAATISTRLPHALPRSPPGQPPALGRTTMCVCRPAGHVQTPRGERSGRLRATTP